MAAKKRPKKRAPAKKRRAIPAPPPTTPATPATKAAARAAISRANAPPNAQQIEHVPTLKGQEGRLDALTLRRKGATYRAIASALDISVSTAHERVKTAIEQLPRELASEVKELELARLDALLEGAWSRATSGYSPASARIVLRVMQRRAALLGLDAPRAMAVSMPPPPPQRIVIAFDDETPACSPSPPPDRPPTSVSGSTGPNPVPSG